MCICFLWEKMKTTLKVYEIVKKIGNTQSVFELSSRLKEKLLSAKLVEDRAVRNSVQDETGESDAIINYIEEEGVVKGMIARIKVGNAMQVQKEKLGASSFTLQDVIVDTNENIAGFIKQSLHFVIKDNYIAVHHRNDMQRKAIETYLNAFFQCNDINLLPIIKQQESINLSEAKAIKLGDNIVNRALTKESDDSRDYTNTKKFVSVFSDTKTKILNLLIESKTVSEHFVQEYIDLLITLNVKKPKKDIEKIAMESLKITDPTNIEIKTHDGKTIKGTNLELKDNQDISLVDGKYLNDNEMYRYLSLLIDRAEDEKNHN